MSKLTTEPTEPMLPAGEGDGDIGDGVPLARDQLLWWGDEAVAWKKKAKP